MHVGRTLAGSTTHAGCRTASSWLLRHARHNPRRWEQPSVISSRAAAETIVTMLSVGGDNCWEVATGLYAEALATHSIGRRGEVALRERHMAIARVLTALTQATTVGMLHGRVARRMARDVKPPRDDASNKEHEAMAMACEAILRVLLASGDFEKAQLCAEGWVRTNTSQTVVRRVIHTLVSEAAGGGRKEEGSREEEGDSDKSAVRRTSLFRCGFLQFLEAATGIPALPALLSLRTEGLTDRCVARWYADAAMHINASLWTLCFAHVPPMSASSEPFYRELLVYCCSDRRWPLPVAALDAMPRSVLQENLADAMRCCQEELGEAERRRLQDAVSTVVVSSRPRREAILCLDLFSRQFSGGNISQEDVGWWCNHLRRCSLDSVESATVWMALCQRIGVEDLMLHSMPSASSVFPLLVVQASRSTTAAEALFTAVQQGGRSPPVVDDLPCASARNLLVLCKDDTSALVADWVLRHCKDRDYLVQFVMEPPAGHGAAALQVLRVMMQPEHADVFVLLSSWLQRRSSTWLSSIASLAPRNMQWVVALRCLSGMAAPSIAHVHVAFLTLAEPCVTPLSVGVDFLWTDDSVTSLQAEVNPSLWQIEAEKWEAALSLLSFGAKNMNARSDLLRCYAHVVSRAAAFSRQEHIRVEDLLAQMKTEEASSTALSAREKLAVLVRRKKWMEACSLVAQVGGGATRGLMGLLAHHGRWVEALRVVVKEHKEAWVPLIIRATRNAGHWQAALWTVEKAVSKRISLHYASIAELLACCAAADVPLEAIQLWLRAQAGETAAHGLIGFGRKNTGAVTEGSLSKTHAELLFVLLDSPRSVDRQWHYALQLLTSHLLQCNVYLSSRLFHTTFSILRRAGRWQESLRLLRFQHLIGVPVTAKMTRLVADALPPTRWRLALICLQGDLRGDAGLLRRVLPKVLPVSWEYALELISGQGEATTTAMECVVGCEQVPLQVRLQTWMRILPSLPVSMRHQAAPVYLRLSLAVSDHGSCLLVGVDGLTVIERSIRGLRHDFQNYAAFVYHRAVVHRHWCYAPLDPAVGVMAFRALSEIAGRDEQCEVSEAALEQLTDLVERQGHMAN
ncbi:hypothetical protein TCDM_07739 [Trypanosoma cruzi Dm28c]|uniref:Uncharacterized protein n=2 Tax=Trypanosoma cruzi TaxID=5693 RepID=V5ATU6_TRYCR|nr:hypothetical protein TCDM_07739 [Trypanosoma cruzi Dm28c]PWU90322.1 hypothetical protein C4B63_51g196 [Trypanosoma cruzi]